MTFVAITSGSNVDFDRLRFVAERADRTEAFVAVRIDERPGALRDMYERCIHPRNVTELSYRFSGNDERPASVFVGFQHSPMKEPHEIVLETLRQNGYECSDLMENELAKSHVRYLCGGRATNVTDELIFRCAASAVPFCAAVPAEVPHPARAPLCRFEFPERPGALLGFLRSLNTDWSISLFHYRSCGASDVGEVRALAQGAEGRGKERGAFYPADGRAPHGIRPPRGRCSSVCVCRSPRGRPSTRRFAASATSSRRRPKTRCTSSSSGEPGVMRTADFCRGGTLLQHLETTFSRSLA